VLGLEIDIGDVRLVFWQRLLQNTPVALDELDAELGVVCRDAPADDRLAFAVLRACASISYSGSEPQRRTLRAALIYWFSRTASKVEAPEGTLLDPMDLFSIAGTHLAWRDCAVLVGGNPDDYSAYGRIVERLHALAREQWSQLYGTEAPFGGSAS
jgi:hypothetical protein